MKYVDEFNDRKIVGKIASEISAIAPAGSASFSRSRDRSSHRSGLVGSTRSSFVSRTSFFSRASAVSAADTEPYAKTAITAVTPRTRFARVISPASSPVRSQFPVP